MGKLSLDGMKAEQYYDLSTVFCSHEVGKCCFVSYAFAYPANDVLGEYLQVEYTCKHFSWEMGID